MADDLLADILALCQALDEQAAVTYTQLATAQGDQSELASFFRQRGESRQTRHDDWNTLLLYAESGIMPQVFDRPAETLVELQNLISRVSCLSTQAADQTTCTAGFRLSYELEALLLHPAFATLYHFMRAIPGMHQVEKEYEAYLRGLPVAMRNFEADTPELTLCGDFLERIWEQNQQLSMKSFTDTLTGVLNRRGLFEMIWPFAHLAKRNNLTVAILLIDLDQFRAINEQYGNQMGDRVLCRVASVLRMHTRQSDLLGRYGGDEFMLYLPSIEPCSLSIVCQNLVRHLTLATQDDIPVTMSIGAAQGFVTGEVKREVDVLIKTAEDRLFEARSRGTSMVRVG